MIVVGCVADTLFRTCVAAVVSKLSCATLRVVQNAQHQESRAGIGSVHCGAACRFAIWKVLGRSGVGTVVEVAAVEIGLGPAS